MNPDSDSWNADRWFLKKYSSHGKPVSKFDIICKKKARKFLFRNENELNKHALFVNCKLSSMYKQNKNSIHLIQPRPIIMKRDMPFFSLKKKTKMDYEYVGYDNPNEEKLYYKI